jgi:hypothetical protein
MFLTVRPKSGDAVLPQGFPVALRPFP